ncbi:MAG: HEAT repeat domain-containing protein [Balneolaceae bacterium]
MKTYKAFFMAFLLPGMLQTAAFGQVWDYEKYPPQDIEFQHLDAEIRIHPDGIIDGDLLYNIRFNTNHIDSLVLDATRVDIRGISVNEQSRDYKIEKDRLIIYLNEQNSVSSGTIRIRYRAEPGFATHKSLNGTTWTSLLPKSVRHWLPVADHPRTKFTTELIFTHPSDKSIVANGRRSESEILSVDEEVTTFRSNRPIPANSLTWALGDLYRAGSTVNSISTPAFQRRSDSQIYMYSETESAADDRLLQVASETFQRVQDQLDYRYPYRDLHIIILEDDKWETKPYGSGVLYVYSNRENLEEQIQTGILSQWTGVYVREEQWADAGAVNVLRALLAEDIFDIEGEFEKQPDPYHVFTDHELWLWRHFIADQENLAFKEHLAENIRTVLTSGTDVLGWRELATIIYDETGRPYFEEPILQQPEIEEEPVEYIAEMQWDEDENTIRLDFQAAGESIDELVTIRAEEVSISESENHELTITGRSESVVLNVSQGIGNLKLYASDREDLILIERKPFLFWIHQLRNDPDVDRRKEAAAGIAQFTGNPDLQLALTDLLRIETNPGVYAEILRSLSAVTAGASGTEQIFLERASGDQPHEVQMAAVESLAYYPDDDRVIRNLRSIVTETGNREIRRAAIRSLFEVTDSETFRNISEAVVTEEPVLLEVPLILNLLVEKEETSTALRLSDTFLDMGFPPEVRKEALALILHHDDSESGWEDRVSDLLSDPDPRIRYMAVNGLEQISPGMRNELVTLRLVEEYDERVVRRLREYQE